MIKYIVITSINKPTLAIKAIAQLINNGWSVVVVGDEKTPKNWNLKGVKYLSIGDQNDFYRDFSIDLPKNHYCRKNIGYLYAMSQGASCILETDDDNIPYPDFGVDIKLEHESREIYGSNWLNIYSYYSNNLIWPRGLPLDEIYSFGKKGELIKKNFPVQQYLADGDPDVDAIYRLLYQEGEVFQKSGNFSPATGCWVPFNSQNTLFYKDAFPLMYLPSHVSFRMTDIWRSFIVQQALWIKGSTVMFGDSTVKQIRNEHGLMKDFSDEVVGYLNNKNIIKALSKASKKLSQDDDIFFILQKLWKSLYEIKIINKQEMVLIKSWISGVKNVMDRD